MRILFVSPRQCWPITSGATLREYHFLRALGEGAHVTYVFFRQPASEPPSPSDLPFCQTIVPVAPPPVYGPARVVQGLIGRWPLPVANYTTDDMMDAIRRAASAGTFDVVHLDSTHLAAYVPLVSEILPRARIFFDWHNIESEGMSRYADLTNSMLKKIYARITARRLEAVERDLIRSPAGHVVCSEREEHKLRAIAPGTDVVVVENGVDVSAFEHEAPAGGHRILFVGLMAYHANIDAIQWFTREIWPRLRQELPGKVLTVVGARPTPAVLALGREPAVEVTGTVPDVKPYYREAYAAIAPLRTGAGTRLKILEAMAARVPVISTAIGAEGLEVQPGRNILLAEEPEDWTAAFRKIAEADTRENIVASARELVERRYDWAVLRRSLFRYYEGGAVHL